MYTEATAKSSIPNGQWPRGSEWRRWDLHVHSPASYGFSGDFNQFIIQLGNADCDVIGINDYFSVAGYRETLRRLEEFGAVQEGNKAYRDSLEKLRAKTLLPVVECRMTNVLVDKKGAGQRINFHLIFDPAIDPENIETLLKAQKVKGSSIGNKYSDSRFLMEDVAVDFNAILDELNADGSFKGRFVVWLPYDEYGGIDNINPNTDKLSKENLITRADVIGSSNKKQADFFLWRDPAFTDDQYAAWFGRRKACIKGSDSHNVNDEIGKLKDHSSKPTDRYCWIKGDPTFNGLKQIINEPADRVFIGTVPAKVARVRDNPTQFVTRLIIAKAAGAEPTDSWFDCDLPLNSDMVAIIGNKGSGKSALADILALAGNTHCDPTNFSFLTKQRFCERNGRLARQFEARLVWADGTEHELSLYAKPDPNGVELVRYIPQAYLEKVCTETEPGQQSEFQIELRKVIFSHIGDADRLGKESLDELIRYKTEELKGQISNTQRELSRINSELTRLEERGTPANVSRIESKLQLKRQELAANANAEPAKVDLPSSVSPEHAATLVEITSKLSVKRMELASLDATIAERQKRQRKVSENIAVAQKVIDKINTFQAEFGRLTRETEADLMTLDIAIGSVVTLSVTTNVLLELRARLLLEKGTIEKDLDPDNASGVIAQRTSCISTIATLQDELDAPNKKYQKYTEALRAWREKGQAIEGDAHTPDTVKGYEAQLAWITSILPDEIARLKTQRREAAISIHDCIGAIRNIYKQLFGAVQNLISDSVIIKEGFKLTFESSIVDRTFQTEFFDHFISQGNVGSFYGKEQGAAVLDELRADVDFNHSAQAISFVEKVVEYLQVDMRNSRNTPTGITSQLRKNVDVRMLYDFLWRFDYLEPEYSLKLDGRDLTHLSPGERGTLLLVFYLLVDKSNKPIIVDQPEENLDSQTVYRLLIPVIKDVKSRRQIIMVTHSPNIAVVCDAEQIIHANIDRAAGNSVIYTMGAIEAPAINRYLVDVLEGTRPAFDNRDSKYYA